MSECYIKKMKKIALFIPLILSFFITKTYATEEFYIDAEEIIKQNKEIKYKEELMVEYNDIEYTTKYVEDENFPTGLIVVKIQGREGSSRKITVKKYENENVLAEEVKKESELSVPVNKVVVVGVGKDKYNYKARKGDSVRVFGTNVYLYSEPNRNSEKGKSVTIGSNVRILEVLDNWYKVQYGKNEGYIESICTYSEDYLNPEKIPVNELTKNLRFDMDLNKKSNLTLEQFQKILSNEKYDKKGVMAANAECFYYAEQQYGLNGVFLAAVAVHESNWGQSKIANDKKNLFGYGASDSNPYGNAGAFESYAEGIDLVARVFVKYYINAPGTIIYDGTAASGKYYHGSNLSGVNVKYASDKNWANGVFKWMKILYGSL